MPGPDHGSRPPQDVRLALVMNGGVSLAIWIGGVTHEIDRLRRAGYPALRELPGATPVGAWQELVEALDVSVSVDVIAGASAGGINGAVLATAIARRAALPPLRDVWLELADWSGDLVAPEGAPMRSFLDGTFFRNGIAEEFAKVRSDTAPTQSTDFDEVAEAEREAPTGVTLFVTGTSLHGKARDYGDDLGRTFREREYRARFSFRRDPHPDYQGAAPGPPRDDFAGARATDQLARAARSTASFPAAFEPMFTRIGAGSDTEEGPDFADRVDFDCSRWLIDGGVLDNEPFRPVLAEIVRRPIDRRMERVLAYVVPAAGVPEGADSPDSAGEMPPVKDTVKAALNLPRETGIVDDFEKLAEILQAVEVDWEMQKALAESDDAWLGDVASSLLARYRTRRALGGLWEAQTVHASRPDRPSVLAPPPAWSVAEEEQPDLPWVPGEGALEPAAGSWEFGLSTAQGMLRTWKRTLRDVLAETAGADIEAAARACSGGLVRLEALEEAFHAAVRAIPGDEPAPADVAAAFTTVMGEDQARIADVVWDAATAVGTAAAGLGAAGPPLLRGSDAERVRRFLRIDVIDRASQTPSSGAGAPRFRFLRVSTNAVSPLDPQRVGEKLAGTELLHFAAFLKPSWRASDWMWGRLDGAVHLVEMLVSPGRLTTLSGPAGDRLRAFVGGDPDGLVASAAGGDAGALRALRDRVAARLHTEIVVEEMPGVAAAEWRERESTGDADGVPGWMRALYDDPAHAGRAVSAERAIAGFRACHVADETTAQIFETERGRERLNRVLLSVIRAIEPDVPAAAQGFLPAARAYVQGDTGRAVAVVIKEGAGLAAGAGVRQVRHRAGSAVDGVRRGWRGLRERFG